MDKKSEIQYRLQSLKNKVLRCKCVEICMGIIYDNNRILMKEMRK
jgi:hypothetical protein